MLCRVLTLSLNHTDRNYMSMKNKHENTDYICTIEEDGDSPKVMRDFCPHWENTKTKYLCANWCELIPPTQHLVSHCG